MTPRKILWLVAVTTLVGLLVIALNPDYREAMRSALRGRPGDSPIWRTNARFYPAIEARNAAGGGDDANAR